MCDYSLENYRNRPAQAGEILELQVFGSGTKGFVSPQQSDVAVCLMRGDTVLVASLPSPTPGIKLGANATFEVKQRREFASGAVGHKDALQFEGVSGLVLLQDLPEGLTIEVVSVLAPASSPSSRPAVAAETECVGAD